MPADVAPGSSAAPSTAHAALSIGCLGLGIGSCTLLVGTALVFEDDLEDLTVAIVQNGTELPVGPGADGPQDLDDPAAEELIEPRDLDAIRDGATLYTTEERPSKRMRSCSDREAKRRRTAS